LFDCWQLIDLPSNEKYPKSHTHLISR